MPLDPRQQPLTKNLSGSNPVAQVRIIGDANDLAKGLGGGRRLLELVVIPDMPVVVGQDGRVTLPQKYIDGMTQFAECWPGAVTTLLPSVDEATDNLDNVTLDPSTLNFGVEVRPSNTEGLARRLRGVGAVLGTLCMDQAALPGLCKKLGVAFYYVIEHDVVNRRQMCRVDSPSLLLRWKRQAWTTGHEWVFKRSIRQATGIQCNGTPSYNAYAPYAADPLLFFDTRVGHDMIISPEVLAARLEQLKDTDRPLRLAFTGRLMAIKGVLDLLEVAAHLDAMSVEFTLDICGDGPLRQAMEVRVKQLQLVSRVRMRGVLDFKTELIPFMMEHVDLFVCCHVQSDPACTYLETLACGVPIVGYDNQAFAGIVQRSNTGWLSPMHNAKSLARQISELNDDRESIVEAAQQARRFAGEHDFESTMTERIEQIKRAVTRRTPSQ